MSHPAWLVVPLLWLACNVLALEDAVERLQVGARGEQFLGGVGWPQALQAEVQWPEAIEMAAVTIDPQPARSQSTTAQPTAMASIAVRPLASARS